MCRMKKKFRNEIKTKHFDPSFILIHVMYQILVFQTVYMYKVLDENSISFYRITDNNDIINILYSLTF